MLTVATLTRQVLASCGLERAISIWNPYTRGGKPMAQLVGHTSSVQHVTINEENYQLISCDLSKTMKVWDMRNYKCLQTIQDKARCSVAIVSYRPSRTRRAAGPCYGILNVAVLTMATLATALLTMTTLTAAMLTIATPTMATPTRRATGPWTR